LFLSIPRPPASTLFPYTTLFRSTRTLTHRLAYLVAERGVPAANCLAITFTRRAAAEMRERLAGLLPAAAEPVGIHTFHSLGLARSEEHTSELQSLAYLVCRLLLE